MSMIAAMFRRGAFGSRKSAPRSPQANRNKPEHESATADRDPYLLSQVREAFGRVVYSHKVHEKQADIYFVKYRCQQGALIAFTAISSGTFLATAVDILNNKTLTSLATSSIALLVTWMSLGVKTFKFSEESDAHRTTASQLWDIRESYMSLIADMMSDNISDTDARILRDELQDAACKAYAAAPRTTSRAYKRARRRLKDNEELTFTPREIDLFLPATLRLDDSEV